MAALGRIDELKKRYEENQRRFFAPLANEYRKAGDLEQAIALCRMHLADAPNNLSGQIVFAQALYDAGSLDESRTVFETAIALDPENLIALRHLGDIARTQHDVPTAREWYQRVLDADRRNEEVLALMEELKTLDIAVPEEPAAPAIEAPATAAAATDEAGAMAQSPVSSSASLTGTDTPTLQIVAMSAPPPGPPPAEPEAPAVPAEPEPVGRNTFGFAQPGAEPAYESHAVEETPASSFGFDVDLGAATHIPAAHADEPAADESTSEFGVVELPTESAFSAEPAPEPAAALHEPMDLAFDAPAEPLVAAEAPAAAAAEEMPSVLEYVEEAPPAPPAAAAPSDELFDFELEAPPAPPPAAEPEFEAFELTTGTTPAPPDVAAEPAEIVEALPPLVQRASLESFDPIREMPTPVAPVLAAHELTPAEPAPVYVDAPTAAPVLDETPAMEPGAEEPPATAPAAPEAFATETMAELYVQQGLRQEAIGVYRQLLVVRPDDAALRARLGELTGEIRKPASSTARAFFANLAGRRATPLRTSIIVDAPTPRAPTPVSVAAVDSVAEADYAVPTPVAEPAADAHEAPVTDSAPVSEPSTGGTLDALFGHSNVATPDNSAAQALASAFANTPTPPSGRPTRAASDEFSLDRVFRDNSATPSKGGLTVPRQSSALRFDQFFTPAPDAQGNAPAAPPPTTPGGESEQFQSWLSGLKKP